MEFSQQPYESLPSDMGGVIQYDASRQFDVFDIWMAEIRLKQIINSRKQFKTSGDLKVEGEFGEIERKVDEQGKIKSLLWKTKKGGKVAELNYKNGNLDGKAMIWHSNGQLRAEGFFIDGFAEGTWKTYFPDGNTASIRNYQMGALEGTFKEYYSNTQLAVAVNFQNAYLFGEFQKWNQEGNSIMKGQMNRGVKEGAWTYQFELPEVLNEFINRNSAFWLNSFKMEGRFTKETLKDHKLLVKAVYELERNEKCLNQLCSRMKIESVE